MRNERDAARRDLEELGLQTVHLHAITIEGKCACGHKNCGAAGKHQKPFGTWDEGAGYGVLTGSVSGIFVVDVDVKTNVADGDGMENLRRLGDITETFTVATPSGGFHFYYKIPPGFTVRNSASTVAKHVDIRGEGGYVVGPGSPHARGRLNGGLYVIYKDLPMAYPPGWLLSEVCVAGRAKAPLAAIIPTAIDIETPEGQRRVDEFISHCQTAAPSIEGQNGSGALFRVCEYGVRGLCLPTSVVLAVVLAIYNPRAVPPWSDEEVERKVEGALKDGRLEPNRVYPDLSFVSKTTPLEKIQESLVAEDAALVRNVPNPNHRYSYEPGMPSAYKAKKITRSEMTSILFRSEEWLGVFQYDEFSDRIMAVNPPLKLDCETGDLTDRDTWNICCWFENQGALCQQRDIAQAVPSVAARRSFHAVQDYLNGMEDLEDTSILDTLATGLFGCDTREENMYFKMFLIGAVRRALQPGCQMDTILVLRGRQGVGKSSACAALFGNQWFTNQMPDLHNRDASMALRGCWGVEFSELKAIIRSGEAVVKDFLTRCVDKYRAFGKADQVIRPRACVFMGTTNASDFLSDDTGNRRYWVLEVNKQVDVEKVKELRDLIWRAAVTEARRGTPHYTSGADSEEVETRNQQFLGDDPWTQDIVDYCYGKDFVTNAEIIKNVVTPMGSGLLNLNMGHVYRVSKVLIKLFGANKHRGKLRIRTWETKGKVAFEDLSPKKQAALKLEQN